MTDEVCEAFCLDARVSLIRQIVALGSTVSKLLARLFYCARLNVSELMLMQPLSTLILNVLRPAGAVISVWS